MTTLPVKFVLDTNAVITLLGNKSELLSQRVFACSAGEIGLPSVVVYELYYGAYKSQKIAHNLETLRLFLSDFPILDFTFNDARQAGEIRAVLAKAGTPIGPYDIMIAAQAKSRALTLITNNIVEFLRVSGLAVQDWTKS